ncbi:hypothetical protein Dtox_3236 [Desulfofarcimen acetoxidans DSM 771]|jgi:hypothetical protein|uniref:Sporulation stage 0, Spo0E-like regulatory phosphatase n=1 Tax=Desulfofarcimen acetoxidans (strain ATCC 49208 / DSM 771 / KCTC 5769 / VKM B-1644 / 5575) TaxID=485916 RepID=C8W4T9_DESAS|nr:aspartyl-phosphate phosphatase Spo0E family protein [Desulfofarcimen acetoxidans]ACV63975.1 hypothetical protein Dtox_3236 [Desulfofarcimen acetoxidans DSM 771]
MNLAKIIIKIEKTRRKLNNVGRNNPEKLLKVSQELDILMNQYFKLKEDKTTSQENYCQEINYVPHKENEVSYIYCDQSSTKLNKLA